MTDVSDLHRLFWAARDKDAQAQLESWITQYGAALRVLQSPGKAMLGSWVPSAERYGRARESRFPALGTQTDEVVARLLELIPGSVDWASPVSAMGPAAPPTLAAIFARLICNHLNPNLLHDLYSQQFAVAEIQLSAMLCDLVGYPASSAGVTTYGGAGAVLYGVRLGVDRALELTGVDRSRVRLFVGAKAHHSTLKAATWLGLGPDAVVEVASRSGRIDSADLARKLSQQVDAGNVAAVITAEIGTTTDFAVDDVSEIADIASTLQAELRLPYRPFIHADAAIGGIYAVFNSYDLNTNPLGFSDGALEALRAIVPRVRALNAADSIGFDFHKLGFAPLTSTVFLVKDAARLHDLDSRGVHLSVQSLAAREAWPSERGQYEPGTWTLEASRSADGVIAAYVNCLLLGAAGYQRLLGYLLGLATQFRIGLHGLRYCRVLNHDNPGPAVVLGVSSEDDADLDDQLTMRVFTECARRSELAGGLQLSLVRGYPVGDGPSASHTRVTAMKGYLISPLTTSEHVSRTLANIESACATVMNVS